MSEPIQPQPPEQDAPEIDEQDLDSVAGGKSIRIPDVVIQPIWPPIVTLPSPTFPVEVDKL